MHRRGKPNIWKREYILLKLYLCGVLVVDAVMSGGRLEGVVAVEVVKEVVAAAAAAAAVLPAKWL